MVEKRVKRSKRKTHKKKVPTNKQLATRIKRIENQEELKYVDYYTSTVWDNPGFIVSPFTLIAQGDDFDNRMGEEVTAKRLEFMYNVYQTTSNVSHLRYRVIVGWDLQANGAAPGIYTSISGLVNGAFDDSTISSAFLSPINYRTKQRYHILYDKYKVMPIFQPNATASSNGRSFKKTIMLHNAKVKYSSSSASITAMSSRNLFIFVICQASSFCAFNLGARVYYTDA